MKREELLKNKYLYKMLLVSLKIIPMIVAFLSLANTILSYFDLYSDLFSFVGGLSLLSLLFLYLSSYAFGFCSYHRMFLHYITITWIINIYDYYIGIPVDEFNFLCFHMILAGIFLFIILYLYVKINKETTFRHH